jgi:nitrogen regulatory protein PII
MKLISAIIKPHRLDAARDAVAELGILGFTATEVRGFGRQKGHTELYRGTEYEVEFLPKVKIEIAVPDGSVTAVIEAVTNAAYTGSIGDGKVFVTDLHDAVRIRTAEAGDGALV